MNEHRAEDRGQGRLLVGKEHRAQDRRQGRL
jgi:hypothetical protein